MQTDLTPGWRALDSAARERAYSPSSCIGGHYQPFIQAYALRSQQAHAALPARRSLAYGAAKRQVLDLFVPTDCSAPPALLVFIHGGYWQELSKDESAFSAGAALAQGLAFAALDYTLAPQATLAEMVAECRQALAWLQRHAASLGFDGHRIVLAGSSAGAHLAAMTALPAAWDGAGCGAAEPVTTALGAASSSAAAANPVRAVVLVSGIYEVEPLVGTTINDALGLTVDTARVLSPALQPLAGFPPAIVCWGAIETDEFKRQGIDFARQLGQAGSNCLTFEVPGKNHFDIVLDLLQPGTRLGDATRDLIDRV